jgi:hypothetical protein
VTYTDQKGAMAKAKRNKKKHDETPVSRQAQIAEVAIATQHILAETQIELSNLSMLITLEGK